MSEEFIRCSECGNLNIQGSTRCVFCNNAFEEIKTKPKKESPPEVSSIPSVTDVPDPVTEQKEEEKSLPKIPDIDITQQEPQKKEIVVKDAEFQEPSFTKKFSMISLYAILIAIVHYFLNLLVSVISVRIDNPNVDAYPLPADLNQFISINAVSIILGIPFAIMIGYVIGKTIRRFNQKKSKIIAWFSYALFIDLVINVVIAIVLVFAFGALNDKDILFLKLIGAAFIFIGVSIFTLFLPMIVGSFLVYFKVDKMFFPKKYIEF